MKKAKKTFISYSKDASVKAHQIAGYIGPLGAETFLFEKSMDEDQPDPADAVHSEIESSAVVIMVLSAESRDSPWVLYEITLAIGMGKRVFVYKTAHNLILPDQISERRVTVLSRLEELDRVYGE